MDRPKEDEQRVPGQPPRDEGTYPAGMEEERSDPDETTNRPIDRRDNARIDDPTTSRPRPDIDNNAPDEETNDPTQ